MPDAPEDTYNRLIVRRDLVALDDDRTLEHMGEFTDRSGNAALRAVPNKP